MQTFPGRGRQRAGGHGAWLDCSMTCIEIWVNVGRSKETPLTSSQVGENHVSPTRAASRCKPARTHLPLRGRGEAREALQDSLRNRKKVSKQESGGCLNALTLARLVPPREDERRTGVTHHEAAVLDGHKAVGQAGFGEGRSGAGEQQEGQQRAGRKRRGERRRRPHLRSKGGEGENYGSSRSPRTAEQNSCSIEQLWYAAPFSWP